MDDNLREILQFVVGGMGLAITVSELVRRWWVERSNLLLNVTGRSNTHKVGYKFVHQIYVQVTNRSKLDNSISECWLMWESQQARPPTCAMPSEEVKTATDGKRIFKVVFPSFEVEPSVIEFPFFIKAHETVGGYIVFSTTSEELDDIKRSQTKLRIRDSHSKWYERGVRL